MAEDRKAVRVRVKGKVQGVSFRVWARTEARGLGLSGWVRNEDDGTVTALIVGSDVAVSTMVERFWIGPAGASVVSVETDFTSLPEERSGFHIAD